MRLIVGLGNPGKKYENTKHNVGFLVISKFKDQIPKIQTKNAKIGSKFSSEIVEMKYNNEKILLVKPQTFMNNSGEAVKKIMDYYKIGFDDLWVICDDLDLELGQIRVRIEGSSGGHKGLQSIIERVGDNRFSRFRVGIGSNRKVTSYKLQVTSLDIPAEEYVLQKFSKDEQKSINMVIDKCADLVIKSLDKGINEETIKIV